MPSSAYGVNYMSNTGPFGTKPDFSPSALYNQYRLVWNAACISLDIQVPTPNKMFLHTT